MCGPTLKVHLAGTRICERFRDESIHLTGFCAVPWVHLARTRFVLGFVTKVSTSRDLPAIKTHGMDKYRAHEKSHSTTG